MTVQDDRVELTSAGYAWSSDRADNRPVPSRCELSVAGIE